MPERRRAPDLPSTIARSDQHAQDIWAERLDSAVESYGEGERSHRTVFAALKHQYEKVGDHWERKERSGPSDEQAEGGVGTHRETAGGVDANASKQHLLELAKRLDIRGRSLMTKDQRVDAIQRANDRATARNRG